MAIKVGRCLLQEQLIRIGSSPTDLAERMDMKKSQISDYINNRRTMDLHTAYNIANEIGCTVEDLYELIEIPASERKRSRRKGRQ